MSQRGVKKSNPRHALSVEDLTVLAEWLFLETIDDLRQRCRQVEPIDRYATLGIAALLRKVLIDGTQMVNYVRRQHPAVPAPVFRMAKWTFEGPPVGVGGTPTWLLSGTNLIPEPDGREPGRDLTREQFLADVIGTLYEKGDLTVKDVIKYFANAEGAVHFGQPSNVRERTLMESVPHMLKLGVPAMSTAVGSLLALSFITVRAFTPLAEAARAKPSSPQFSRYAIQYDPPERPVWDQFAQCL